MELDKAITLAKKEVRENIRRARIKALKKKLIIIVVAVIVFAVSFFLGLNFFKDIAWATLLSFLLTIEFAVLAGLVLSLCE